MIPKRLRPTTRRRTPTGDAIRQLVRNKAAVVSIVLISIMIFIAIFVDTLVFSLFTGAEPQPLLAPYHYATVDFAYTNAPGMTRTPEGNLYILGTDYLGRDNLSRTMYGTRISLAVAFVAATVSIIVGMIFGMISGYGSSTRDNIMMRFVDFLYGFPLIIFIILMQVYFKALAGSDVQNPITQWILDVDQAMGGIFLIFIAIGLVSWLGMARITRGQTLSYKQKEFVEAASRQASPTCSVTARRWMIPSCWMPWMSWMTRTLCCLDSCRLLIRFVRVAQRPVPSFSRRRHLIRVH